ncbi:MAG TPA: ABC transporter substrate-binding protein [Acidimicrobiales bacterium]|nr:ABC transporter substrate-binding protein [Acidimicrobiales bacterium]
MAIHRSIRLLTLVALVLALSACQTASNDRSAGNSLQDDAITVGSFDFVESELLAEIYSQALEAGGYTVRRAFRLGPREFVAPALQSGLIEFVPEYAGTAVQFLSLGETVASSDAAEAHAALERTLHGSRITALAPAPARDSNAVVVTRQTADRLKLQRISDVIGVASTLTFGGPPECPSRPLCLVGLERVYGLEFKEFVPLDVGGPLTHQALANGNVDIALLFTTDPAIDRERFVELEDDRRLQPAESVTPLVRREVVDRWGPRVVQVIDAVSRELTTDDLRDLNGQVTSGTMNVVAAATAWLKASRSR